MTIKEKKKHLKCSVQHSGSPSNEQTGAIVKNKIPAGQLSLIIATQSTHRNKIDATTLPQRFAVKKYAPKLRVNKPASLSPLRRKAKQKQVQRKHCGKPPSCSNPSTAGLIRQQTHPTRQQRKQHALLYNTRDTRPRTKPSVDGMNWCAPLSIHSTSSLSIWHCTIKLAVEISTARIYKPARKGKKKKKTTRAETSDFAYTPQFDDNINKLRRATIPTQTPYKH